MLPTKYFIFSLLVGILFISSCSDPGTRRNITTVTIESAKISTPIPENTPSLTPLPTETKPIPTPLPAIKTQCVGNSKESWKLDSRGVVALEKAAKQDDGEFGLFMLNLRNRNTVRDVEEGLFVQVSPDGKYLAYFYPKNHTSFLQVVDSNGKTISNFEFKFDERWPDYFNWQNPEQLRTVTTDYTDVSVQLLNPFTQTHDPLKTDWQGAYRPTNPFQEQVADWKFDRKATELFAVYGANILYDPTLTRVLYPKDDGTVSLVNVGTEAELANVRFEDWGRLPSWSPNGEYLTILNREGSTDDFYLISMDRTEFQKITDFSKEFGIASISDYTWSPDGKQIAFWLNTESDNQEDGAQSELAILDIPSREVTRLCIQGISSNAYEPWIMNHPEPIWSPDGRYIMLTQWDDPASPRNYDVLAIDPLTGAVKKISENTAPIGWMSNE